MRKKFSKNWVRSKQPRKQRKYRYNAPLHVRHKFVSAHLSKDLREKYGTRSIPVRKGDEVEVMRGRFKGIAGKVTKVDLKRCRVYVDSVKIKKVDGSEAHLPLEPSNLLLKDINLDDKRRLAVIERRRSVKHVPQ